MAVKTKSRRATVRKPRGTKPGCVVRYDLAVGELTGVMRHSEVPWDTPDTWWMDALVTFIVGDDVRRTDGYEMGVTMEPGASMAQVRERLLFILTRICAVEATVTHIRPPMDIETILWIRQENAQLVKAMLARRKAENTPQSHGEYGE